MPEIRNPIQRFFYDKLTNGGLDLVDADRVDKLIEYAKKNVVSETGAQPVADGGTQEVDAFEKTALKGLLESDSWRSLLTDAGVHKLEQHLGITSTAVRVGTGRDAVGEVPRGSIAGNLTSYIGTVDNLKFEHLNDLFNYEYAQRKGELFENPSLSEDDKAKNLFFLFQDYAKALNSFTGKLSEAALVSERKELMQAFFSKPGAARYGAADPDDDLLGNAFEILWGIDPERPESSFVVDKEKQWSAYMSMGGGFVPTAAKMDAYLTELGRPAHCEAFEKKSPLNWIVGEQAGNTKPSSTFSEGQAISSTGVDFAVKLLADEAAIGDRSLDPSFDMKVDFYAFNNFVSLNKAQGETLVPVHDETGAELKVEIKKVGDQHWQPVFKDADGNDVDPSKVTSVIKGADGQVKGDGKASGSYSASWWGFCDRNAMQGLVTLKYGMAKPSKDVTLKVDDKEFTFTAADITSIVGRRLTEIFPLHTQAGNRYDEEPDQVRLKSGETLLGKIKSSIDFYEPDTYRVEDNMVVVPGKADGPRGSLLIKVDGESRDVAVNDIAEIRRAAQRGSGAIVREAPKDTIVLKDGTEMTGTMESKLSFSGAEVGANGAQVLKNSDDKPLLGDVLMTTRRGEDKRVSLGDVSYMLREDQEEILGEEALAYIIRNKGVFCADSWAHSSVANGTRTIEEINRWSAGTADKPDWVPDDISTLEGYHGKVKDPDNVMFFSLGNKGSSYGGLKFWVEMDENRVPINSKMISGQWDFLWGVEGKPDWDAKATFNPNVPNDLVLKLYINSLENPEAMKDNLPENWREYLND